MRNILVAVFVSILCFVVFDYTKAETPQRTAAKLPVTNLEYVVFDFSSGKVKRLKQSDFATEAELDKQVRQDGDIIYKAEPGEQTVGMIGVFSMQVVDLTTTDFAQLSGRDLGHTVKKVEGVPVKKGSVVLLQTRARRYVLLRVLDLSPLEISFEWIPGEGEKAVFPQVSFDKSASAGAAALALEKGRRATETRNSYIRNSLRSATAFTAPGEKPAKLQSTPDPRDDLRALAHLGNEFWYMERFLRPVEAAAVAIEHSDVMWEDAKGTKLEIAVELLKTIGRPASVLIIGKLRNEKLLTQARRDRLRQILDQIEGPVVAATLLENPPPLPPPVPVKSPGGTLRPMYMELPVLGLPKIIYAQRDAKYITQAVLSFSSGRLLEAPILDENKIGEEALLKASKNEKLMNETIQYIGQEYGKVGDLAVWGGAFIIPSNRYAVLGGTFDSYAGKDLTRLVLKQSTPMTTLLPSSVLVLETRDHKYAMIQIVPVLLERTKEEKAITVSIYKLYQPNGTAFFDVEPLPTPQELLSRRPEASPREIVAYLNLSRGWFQPLPSSTDGLIGILDGSVRGTTLSDKSQALHYLGELRVFEAADLMIRYLDVEFPGNSEHPAIQALTAIQPAARQALLAAIKKPKDQAQRMLLIKALEKIEGKAVADKLLQTVQNK